MSNIIKDVITIVKVNPQNVVKERKNNIIKLKHSRRNEGVLCLTFRCFIREPLCEVIVDNENIMENLNGSSGCYCNLKNDAEIELHETSMRRGKDIIATFIEFIGGGRRISLSAERAFARFDVWLASSLRDLLIKEFPKEEKTIKKEYVKFIIELPSLRN